MKSFIIILSPLIVLIEIVWVTAFTDLLSQKSDMAVLLGVVLITIGLSINFLLFKYLVSLFKFKKQ